MDELTAKEGPEAAIAFLHNLNIAYVGGRVGIGRKFRVSVHDPYRPDIPLGWMLDDRITATFLDALLEFADRHEKTRLIRHAKNGNINALDNYLDILLAITRLLFAHYRRGMKLAGHIVGRYLRYVSISTIGIQTDNEVTSGLLWTIFEHHRNDPLKMQEALHSSNYMANVQALLLIAKLVRREWRPQDGASLADHLKSRDAALRTTIFEIGMKMPDRASLSEALRGFGILDEREICELLDAHG